MPNPADADFCGGSPNEPDRHLKRVAEQGSMRDTRLALTASGGILKSHPWSSDAD